MVSERIRSDALFPDSDAGWNFLERSTNRANFSVSLKIRSAVKQAAISFVTRVIAPVSPKRFSLSSIDMQLTFWNKCN